MPRRRPSCAAACQWTLAGDCTTSPAEMHSGPMPVHNGTVKFRIGTAIAFLSATPWAPEAGRERYRQIMRLAGEVGRSAPVSGTVTLVGDKAKAVATLGCRADEGRHRRPAGVARR